MLTPHTRIRHYELIRELGRGGMGRVFLARDTRLGRRVAMKFMAAVSPEMTQRFLIEARATARCSHENIVVIHEVDIFEGRPYMVLEYLEGATLASTIAGRRLRPAQAAELMVPVVRALVRAHEAGILHRDLKPENVFVTASGTIKVLDFGVAKLLAGGADDPPRPAPDAVGGESMPAGTIPYMAPEQVFMDVDARTDLWPVGVMLHEMLSGRHPYAGLTGQLLLDEVMKLDEPVPTPADGLPDGLARVVARCLAKRKADRFASARELLAELEPYLPGRHGRPLGEDESPYPGLGAFEEDAAARFFGRGEDVALAVARLARHPVVGIVGPSGVGKSSFVRAGLVPALKASDEAWETIVLRPGRRPLAALAGALARLGAADPTSGDDATVPLARGSAPTATRETPPAPARLAAEPGVLGAFLRDRAAARGSSILVFVDQLEELHTLGCEPDERAAFLAALAGVADDVASPLRLVVTLRSDFLDRIAEDRRFGDELGRDLVFLRPLGRAGLHDALARPLELAGYRFEDERLVDDMLDALTGAAGPLPLLQFAATRLWEERDRGRRLVTRRAHDQLGGVSGALAAHADAVLQALPAPARRLARTVVCRLVTPERTRAAVELAELRALGTAADVEALIEQLAAARLLVVQSRGEGEGPAVELVHDPLVEGWPALRRWLDERNEDAAFLAELGAAARQWEARGRGPGLLWTGEAMAEARLWRARSRAELPPREAAFLAAVIAQATRAARVRRIVITATIALLAAMVLGAGVALIQIRDARTAALDEAARAGREATRARSAEQRVREQLAVIEAEQRGRKEADAKVTQGEAALRTVNEALQAALRRATEESARARGSAERASQLALSLQSANVELQRLLAEARARSLKLEQERDKIMTKLP